MKNQIKLYKTSIDELEKELSQLDILREENEKLRVQISFFERSKDLTFLDTLINTKYIESHYIFTSDMRPSIINEQEESVRSIFLSIAPKLLIPVSDDDFCELFNKTVNGTYSYLDEELVGKLKAKFLEHELIMIKDSAKDSVKIQLTKFGQEVLNKLNDL